ncbi:MAG: tetratricopeptide repeat protein [Candidatus Thiodiazotropha endolucinida]
MSNTLQNAEKKLRQGKLGDAHKLLTRVLRKAPKNPHALYLLGETLLLQGRLDEALINLRQAVSSGHAQPCWYVMCGVALERKGLYTDAEKSYKLAEMSGCTDERMYYMLGKFYTNVSHDFAKAEIYYANLININPQAFAAYVGLSRLYILQDRYEEAIQALDHCLTQCYESVEVYINLGHALSHQGRQDDALTCMKKAMEIDPGNLIAKQNYIVQLLYTYDDQSTIYSEVKTITRPLNKRTKKQYRGAVDVQPGRKLKIGFVSADLRQHAIAFYFKPILDCFDSDRFSLHFYYNNTVYDEITDALKARADSWCECMLLSDEQLEREIRADKIDILIDLSNHTVGNRLTLFNLRPAPMQVSWLGLPISTGLESIDFSLKDSSLIETCKLRENASEQLLPIENLTLYKPLFEFPALVEPPCVKNGHVTFGSFNGLRKIDISIMEIWARLLHDLPGSKIRLVIDDYQNELMRDHIHDIFAKFNVDKSSVILHPRLPLDDYLLSHNEVDIALDPYPYHGQTTSFNSLLMGLPLVSRAGKSVASNLSTRILSAIDRQQWIAKDFDSYIEIALSLARDKESLVSIRRTLRKEVENSSIMDYVRHAENIEAALMKGWQLLYGANSKEADNQGS